MDIKTVNIFKDDFCREVFEYRRNAVVEMMNDLEILSVKEGIRDIGYVSLFPGQIIELTREHPDLKFILLDKVMMEPFYSITVKDPTNIDDLGFRVAITKNGFAEDLFPEYVDDTDDVVKGLGLGYPKCCVDKFDEEWVKGKKIDYTFEQAVSTPGAQVDGNTVILDDVPVWGNQLTRWFGYKSYFHMPCNFKCEESKKIFYQLKELAHQYNYEREWRWLEEGLNWEVKWDTLHGIGILVTPVSKTRFATSYTAEKKTVIKTGNSDTEHYKPWLWKDNGFADYQSMENLHAPIERIIYDLGDIGSIADLGCGNGYFLTKFDATAYGIDCNPEVIRRARNYFFKNNPENFVVGDITQFEFPDELDVAVIAAIRLIEMNKKDRMEFVAKMIEHTNHIVITGYNDWIEAYGGFKQLVEKTGFEISKFELMPDNNGGAAIVRWKG